MADQNQTLNELKRQIDQLPKEMQFVSRATLLIGESIALCLQRHDLEALEALKQIIDEMFVQAFEILGPDSGRMN
jgi:hypothetical protein